LRRGIGAADDSGMLHRTHRRPATLPARRGMRTPWFRGRATDDGDRPQDPDAVGPPDAAAPSDAAADGMAGEAADAEMSVDPAPVVTPARPAFGHPIF
jgi:hypothetical protein